MRRDMNLGEMRVDVTRRVYLFYIHLFILSHPIDHV
jgi:hypothetical protein